MTPLPIDRAAFAEAAARFDETDPPPLRAIGAALAAIAAGEACSLDRALGLAGAPGRSWLTRLKLAERDQLLREMAARFFPEWPAGAAAEEIAAVVVRYMASAWPRERFLAEPPPRLSGTARELAWRILKMRSRPIAARTIRRVLAMR